MNELKFFEKLHKRCHTIKILIAVYGNNITMKELGAKGIDSVMTKRVFGDGVEADITRLIN